MAVNPNRGKLKLRYLVLDPSYPRRGLSLPVSAPRTLYAFYIRQLLDKKQKYTGSSAHNPGFSPLREILFFIWL